MSTDPMSFRLLTSADPFLRNNGGILAHTAAEGMVYGFEVMQAHLNPQGTCHGGWMATFCDVVLGATVKRSDPALADCRLVTIGLQIDYVAAAHLGAWVEARAEVLSTTRNMAFVQGLVRSGEQLVARASATFRLNRPGS